MERKGFEHKKTQDKITGGDSECELVFIAHNGKTFDHPFLKNFLGISEQNPKINNCKTIWLDSIKLLKISSGKGGILRNLLQIVL